jgi:hypothetical protein
MNRLNATELEHQIAFARRAATVFATTPKAMTYSERSDRPEETSEPGAGDWFAMRGECCVITFKIDEFVPVRMWMDMLLEAEKKAATPKTGRPAIDDDSLFVEMRKLRQADPGLSIVKAAHLAFEKRPEFYSARDLERVRKRFRRIEATKP